MKAMLLAEYKKLEIVDVPLPAFGPKDLLVRVRACGICGSDIHGYDGSTGRRRPPLIMGHEAAGEIAAIGDAVKGFAVGDRVTFDSTISCGECPACRRGRINLCQNRQVLGVACDEFQRHGAFAEYVVVPHHISYRLPENMPYEHAALIEAVSIAVHAVGRLNVPLGSVGVVVGAGMIGLLVIQALKRAGCTTIIAVDLSDQRLQHAEGLGADILINSTHQNPLQEIARCTDGQGADVVLEVVGCAATVDVAIQAARRGGQVVLVGNLAPRVEIPLQMTVNRELTLYGSCASNGEYPQCIALMEQGAIQVQSLITALAPLDDGPRWFQRLYAGEDGAMKVILQP